MTPVDSFLVTREAFSEFVKAWECGMLPKANWSHAAHVAVGACYTVRYGGQALAFMRRGILRYNQAVGTANTDTSGYHETLTRFWITILANVITGEHDEWIAARLSVEKFGGNRDLHKQFYSFDVVQSVEARRQWIAPDLARPKTVIF